MTDGFPNKPRILRGAFVEFGLSLPPLVVVFQFNPMELTRNRSLTYSFPAEKEPQRTLRQIHGDFSSLLDLQDQQLVTVEEQEIGFDIRLDATDKLNEGDTITEQFGIAPQIATLELMVLPRNESQLGVDLVGALRERKGYSSNRKSNPPLILFIFGRKRVLPVNINSMNITETEFSTNLDPIRATVAVNLTVIEGGSDPYMYSKTMTEAMSAVNLASITDVTNVVIPR